MKKIALLLLLSGSVTFQMFGMKRIGDVMHEMSEKMSEKAQKIHDLLEHDKAGELRNLFRELVNAKRADGKTPLAAVCYHGHQENCFDVLMEHGADVNEGFPFLEALKTHEGHCDKKFGFAALKGATFRMMQKLLDSKKMSLEHLNKAKAEINNFMQICEAGARIIPFPKSIFSGKFATAIRDNPFHKDVYLYLLQKIDNQITEITKKQKTPEMIHLIEGWAKRTWPGLVTAIKEMETETTTPTN